MVVYCSVVNMSMECSFLNELRTVAVFQIRRYPCTNILIAWPYGGVCRDLFMRAAHNTATQAGWAKNLADVLAYVTFQSPVYVIIIC
ncbi:L-alanine exporter AlaE [Shigella flexneri]